MEAINILPPKFSDVPLFSFASYILGNFQIWQEKDIKPISKSKYSQLKSTFKILLPMWATYLKCCRFLCAISIVGVTNFTSSNSTLNFFAFLVNFFASFFFTTCSKKLQAVVFLFSSSNDVHLICCTSDFMSYVFSIYWTSPSEKKKKKKCEKYSGTSAPIFGSARPFWSAEGSQIPIHCSTNCQVFSKSHNSATIKGPSISIPLHRFIVSCLVDTKFASFGHAPRHIKSKRNICFLAALAALYLTLVSQSVGGWVPL